MLEKLYEQIDKLRDGNERVCDKCGEILKSKYFPYKFINLCLWCYEKNHNIILRTLRKKLRLTKFAVSPNKILKGLVCPYCNEETIIKDGFIYVCSTCNSEVNVKKKHIQNTQKTKIKKKDQFIRETATGKILTYLKNQKESNKPIEFYYRNDVKPRKIYDYFLDEKYINVRSEQGYYIKFLIDRIRKI